MRAARGRERGGPARCWGTGRIRPRGRSLPALSQGPRGASTAVARLGWCFPGDGADSAAPLASASGGVPGARSRNRRLDSVAIATLPKKGSSAHRGGTEARAGRGVGAVKKQTETAGPLAAMPSPRASPREEGRRNPSPGRRRGRCPGSGPVVSATLPARRARKSYAAPIHRDRKGLRVPETGTPPRPPPAGPAPRPHPPRPKFRRCRRRSDSARASRDAEAGGGHRRGAAL